MVKLSKLLIYSHYLEVGIACIKFIMITFFFFLTPKILLLVSLIYVKVANRVYNLKICFFSFFFFFFLTPKL